MIPGYYEWKTQKEREALVASSTEIPVVHENVPATKIQFPAVTDYDVQEEKLNTTQVNHVPGT